MIRQQYTLYLTNKPGALARAAKVLGAAKINIEGISISESTDVGLVQVIVDDALGARKALNKAGIPYTVQTVAILPLVNKPGALAKIAATLAKAGVNMNYLYGTACNCGCGCDSTIVVSASDLKKVESLWRRK